MSFTGFKQNNILRHNILRKVLHYKHLAKPHNYFDLKKALCFSEFKKVETQKIEDISKLEDKLKISKTIKDVITNIEESPLYTDLKCTLLREVGIKAQHVLESYKTHKEIYARYSGCDAPSMEPSIDIAESHLLELAKSGEDKIKEFIDKNNIKINNNTKINSSYDN